MIEIDDEYYNLEVEDPYESIENDNNPNDANSKIYLIRNEQLESDNPDISEFLNFCIEEGLFNDTFYDYNNDFSVMATKLHLTYKQLNKNGASVKKNVFIKKFGKDFGFKGNIKFIYDCIDSQNKGYITWDEFIDFFLPFVQYVTV